MDGPYVGMPCNFFFGFDTIPAAGIITQVGAEDCCSLMVFHPGFSTFDAYEGIRFYHDEKAEKSLQDGEETGLWYYTIDNLPDGLEPLPCQIPQWMRLATQEVQAPASADDQEPPKTTTKRKITRREETASVE